MTTILTDEHPALRQKANSVSLADIGSPQLEKIIADMKAALASREDGVALAAPQIGVSLRVFIVAGKVFRKSDAEETPPDKVFINPQVIKLSGERQWKEEGCLSVKGLYGRVLRHTKAMVEALDEHGAKFTLGASGLLAQIFQHEMDHLEGALFIDKAEDIHQILSD